MAKKFELDDTSDLERIASQLEQLHAAGGGTSRTEVLVTNDAGLPADVEPSSPSPAAVAASTPLPRSAIMFRVAMVMVSLLVLFILITLVYPLFRGQQGGPSGAMTVPDVIGKPQTTVMAQLDKAGIKVKVQYDATSRKPQGTVLAVAPPAGTTITPDTEVTISVAGTAPTSTGAPRGPGAPKPGAASVAQPTTDPGASTEPSTLPVTVPGQPAGGLPQPGQPAANSVEIPDIIGVNATEAEMTLRDLGLVVKTIDDYDPTQSNNVVLRCSPSPGTQVDAKSTITLTVNIPLITVRDYTGLDGYEVSRDLKRLGLSPTIVTENAGDQARGNVIRTEPARGSKVNPGDTVTIFVAQ